MQAEALSAERRSVIENIAAAVSDGDSFRKVELHDPKITDEDIRRVILPFDNKRRGIVGRTKALAARLLAEKFTKSVNALTELRGEENMADITGGAIITANHYNPTDSTPIRILARRHGARRRLHIVVQETNIFMTGLFGFLMKNCNTHPVSRNAEYMVKNLRPALEDILRRGNLVLIYPEQEMWFNYKKPRELRDGAYHYAALFGVPIVPTFTEMVTQDGERDADGILPVKHILHIMPPIFPDPKLSVRENREMMRARDMELRRAKYEEVYGSSPDTPFCPERDIAGLRAQ
jgi:1-acyl-sn-glycerol-3-phosphate acyltransferase